MIASRTDAIAKRLDAALGRNVQRDVAAAPLTTYRCGGPIAVVVEVTSDAEISAVAELLASAPEVPVLVIGRGSNLLVSDAGFAGVGIVLAGAFDEVEFDREAGAGDDTPIVHAGGAVALPVLARRSVAAGIGGLEFYVGIPGSVGGAVRMNAGGHGAQTRDVLVDARIVDLRAASIRSVPVDALELGYRRSALAARDVVIGARFAGVRQDPAVGAAQIDEIVRWRREHQPGGQNAGSVFTNPPGDSAGRLIESCGAKGLRRGAVTVSEKHANFFVAEPGASADDVYHLIREVQARVEDATGVRLHPEVHLVGFSEEER